MYVDSQFPGDRDEATCGQIAPLPVWRWLQEFDQVKVLVVDDVKVFEFLRMKQTKVLVTPSSLGHIRRSSDDLFLQSSVVLIIAVWRKPLQQFRASHKLVSMLSGDLDCLIKRQFFLFLGATRHPDSRLFATIDAELESAAASDTAKVCWELLVVLEL
jgi:hypothetical protein